MAEISATMVKELRERSGAGMMLCKKALQETAGDVNAAIEYLRKQGEITAGKRAGRAAKEGKIGILVQDGRGVMVELNSETDFVARNKDFLVLLDSLLAAAVKAAPADLDAFNQTPLADFQNKKVQDVVSEKIGTIGENIQLRRISVLDQPAGTRVFSYVHMGGKIGVLLRLKGEDGALNGDKGAELGKDLAMQVAAANPLTVRREEIAREKIESESAIFRELALKEGKPEKILDRIVQGRLNKFFQENCLLEQPFIKETEKSVSKHIDETSKGAGAEFSVDAFVRFQLGAE